MNVLYAVPWLVRLRLLWKRWTCWNSPECFTLFPDPWKSLGDAERTFENQHKSCVITAKSWYDALEKSVNTEFG